MHFLCLICSASGELTGASEATVTFYIWSFVCHLMDFDVCQLQQKVFFLFPEKIQLTPSGNSPQKQSWFGGKRGTYTILIWCYGWSCMLLASIVNRKNISRKCWQCSVSCEWSECGDWSGPVPVRPWFLEIHLTVTHQHEPDTNAPSPTHSNPEGSTRSLRLEGVFLFLQTGLQISPARADGHGLMKSCIRCFRSCNHTLICCTRWHVDVFIRILYLWILFIWIG